MLRGPLLIGFGLIAMVAITLSTGPAPAADSADQTVKIGLILPMTGQQASTGKQIDAAVQLFIKQHGTQVAGKTIEVVLKDDASLPDNTKRLAQELIVNDRVAVIADKRIVATGTPRELEQSDHPWIREYFLGPRGRAAAAAKSGRG